MNSVAVIIILLHRSERCIQYYNVVRMQAENIMYTLLAIHRQPPKKHNHNGTGVYLRPCSIDPDSPVGNTSIVCAENSSAVLSILVGTAGSASS